MRDIKSTCKTALDNIKTPEFDFNEIQNNSHMQKVISKRRRASIISVFLFLMVLSLISGITAYAVKMTKSIKFTESGYKVDATDESYTDEGAVEDYYISGQEPDTYDDGATLEEQAIGYDDEQPLNEEDAGTICYSVEEAEELVPFEIVSPVLDAFNLDEIYVYTPDDPGFNYYNVIFCYSNEDKKVEINYRQFQDEDWSYETNFLNEIDSFTYENESGDTFSIVEYDTDFEERCYEAAFVYGDYLILVDTKGLAEKELKETLETINLSIYKN